jgi:hypothetical protein
MERHVALIAVAKIIFGVFRPLINFGEQHSAWKGAIDLSTKLLEDGMSFRKILVGRTFAFDKIRHRIEP